MTRNPFLGRTPVDSCDLFFGRRIEVRTIVNLFGSEVPQSCSLVGKRRIGKTSLANFATHPAGGLQEFARLLAFPAEQYLFVYIDLELLHLPASDRDGGARLAFFRYLFARLNQAAQARLTERGRDIGELARHFNTHYSSGDVNVLVQEGLDPYLGLLEERKLVSVLILDEADNVITLGVGGTLRALIGSRPLAYIVISRSPMQDIDPERASSPLYNLCMPLQLGLLAHADAAALVTTPALRANCPFTPEEVKFILETGGCHPEFLKVAARHVFDGRETDKQARRPATSLRELYRPIFRELDGSCRSLWHSLTDEQQQAVARIAARQPLPGQSAPLIYTLEDQGILTSAGGAEPALFSPVFADFARRHAPTGTRPAETTLLALQARLVFGEDHFVFEGSRVPATGLELRILRYLYQHAGHPCRREDIYEFAWQEGSYTDAKEATVNIAVQRLRNKLRQHLSSRLVIESVRGQGYTLAG